MRNILYTFASPSTFYPLARRLTPFFSAASALFALIGLWIGFFIAPTDWQQGESYRILFIHVPAAWIAMLTYISIAFWSLLALSLNARLPAMMAQALTPTGALFSFVALWSGAFWGRPTWGTYWVWDARLTSTLLLMFLYLGLLALHASIESPRQANRATALLAIVGVVNLPVIYFSVYWWNTLHQGSSLSAQSRHMDHTVLTGLLLMFCSTWCYTVAVALHRVQSFIIEREKNMGQARSAPTQPCNEASLPGNR